MKKKYFLQFSKVIIVSTLLLCIQFSAAQIEYRYLSGFGSALLDINNSGQAIKRQGVYDFATSTTTPIDPEAQELSGINNYGDLIGSVPLLIGVDTYSQPGYKRDGVWYPMGVLPGSTVDASFSNYQISENGKYITGQMSPDCCNAQAFLYDTSTGVLERIADPANEYSAGYTVNDSGILGGWYDPQPTGTLRVPAYMTTGSVITTVPAALPQFNGELNAISNTNIMVGTRDGKPFIFDQVTNTYTDFPVPSGYETATFTSVSDNGIAVGYCQIFDFNGLTREAIIHHPSLGNNLVFIKDLLTDVGITIPTIDGKLGTAIAISPDGNYLCGWENAPFIFATGWAINFNSELISSCYINCPQDIVSFSLTGPKVIEYTLPIICEVPGSTIVLESGLESGSLFPIGSTDVVHNLIAADGVTVLDYCFFTVTITDTLCDPAADINIVEPITLVNVAEINNSSTENPSNDYEDFTSIVGNVVRGQSYTATFEGFTDGDFTDYFRVFVDWNQDQFFDIATESYYMGSITNSTGIDGIQTSGIIIVPNDAVFGLTTMRIMKNKNNYSPDACTIDSGSGQVEDYKLDVNPPLSTTSFSETNFKSFPNPVKDNLNLINTSIIENVVIYNLLGQEVLQAKLNAKSGKINVSTLASGTYIVKATSNSTVKTIKFIKE